MEKEKQEFKQGEEKAQKNISNIFNPINKYKRSQKKILEAIYGK